MAIHYRTLLKNAPELGAAVFATTYRRMVDHFENNSFGLISAFRASNPLKENLERHNQLANKVRALGHGYVPVIGSWKGIEERSLFVPGISKEDAKRLAVEFGQDSYLWAYHGEWWVWSSVTGELLDSGRNMEKMAPDEDFMNWTAMKNRKNKFRMAAGKKRTR